MNMAAKNVKKQLILLENGAEAFKICEIGFRLYEALAVSLTL